MAFSDIVFVKLSKKNKRLGRGDSSGHGGTSTRGHKGQKARSGGYHKLGFEGGQLPFVRKIPKRGFSRFFRKRIYPINLKTISKIFSGSLQVGISDFVAKGLVKSEASIVKILGEGRLLFPLAITAHFFSESAKKKIQDGGGDYHFEKLPVNQ